jgi:uncharacterized protein (TIGR02145 family)
MRTLILFFILLINFSLLFTQNNAPEVTNVTFSQRTDGTFIVDVYYDLNDADGDTMFVTMQVSEDSGSIWFFACDSTSGDVGDGILSGAGKHIVWDFGGEHPQIFGDAFRIRIIADDHVLTMDTVTDIDGNVYQTVKIGLQWWMAENLKVTHYQNGDSIPNITDNWQWYTLYTGAYCNYNNDTTLVETYGQLYNWFAVDDSRNISPTGWHVPTDDDWKELEIYLGMNLSEINNDGYRGTDEGGKMKETGTMHWINPNTGATNSSGFSALPGGNRYYLNGNFFSMGYAAIFWSSTAVRSYMAWTRILSNDRSGVRRFHTGKTGGLSVRCVRD